MGKERARDLLPPALHKYLHERVLANLWYPEEDWAQLIRAVATLVQEAMPDLREDVWAFMGRVTAQNAIATLYAGIVDKVDPIRTLERAFTLRRVFHNTGFSTGSVSSSSAFAEIRDAGYPFPEYCRMHDGWLDGLLNLSGVEPTRIEETRCVHRGDDCCRWEVSWKLP